MNQLGLSKKLNDVLKEELGDIPYKGVIVYFPKDTVTGKVNSPEDYNVLATIPLSSD
ncbi:hypothetical protein GF412_02650 [Candidatus Micrarchaeota archaeon]|nr:hypothetical protein [Candidatus Micrarchaeota archaeon]MBD3417858.1 hypothetical protein [Candidatus Micrarchaeota archaeon]